MKISFKNVVETEKPTEYKDDIVTVKYNFNLEVASTRSNKGGDKRKNITENEILEVELADGSIWYMQQDELNELNIPVSRGVMTFPNSLMSRSNTRGNESNPIKAVRGAAIELPGKSQIKNKLKDMTTGLVIDGASYLLARGLEKRNGTKGITKLCRVEITGEKTKLHPIGQGYFDPSQLQHPWLLLLHGTMSSTEGSFGGLWGDGADKYAKLRAHYQDRIIALEHNTLTESPIENVATLVDLLPEGINLHLLSHSRGGLIGELLSRGSRRGTDPILSQEQALFKREIEATVDGIDDKVLEMIRQYRAKEVERISTINETLKRKQLSIDQFVRVACPARGTTMASEKLGRWANRVFNVVGLVPALGLNPVYQAFKTFTLGVIKAGTKPAVLPGLYSQMPSSALVLMLNNSEEHVSADLSVVAGDVQARGWKKAPLWVTDKFFGGDHDLVVNTASMDGGTQREKDIHRYFAQGVEVNHFQYFKNAETADAIVRRLIGQKVKGFKAQKIKKGIEIPRGRISRSLEPRPVVYVLPGILGSTLKAGSNEIWLSPLNLALGGMSRLGINQTNVKAGQPFSSHYGELIEFLSNSHQVEVFPYDWRLSLRKLANQLAEKLEDEIKLQQKSRTPQPIRILAHSMGGLVARVMIHEHPEIWNGIIQHPDSRLIMAGTPNKGAYAVPRTLVGQERLVKLLALYDLPNNHKKILTIISQFPGFLEMLPSHGEFDWSLDKTWKIVTENNNERDWEPPAEKQLESVRNVKTILTASKIDPEKMLYVAGVAKRTLSNARLDGRRLKFFYTDKGDGTVTWESGIPEGISKLWYMPEQHASLLANSDYFSAWQELLQRGDTALLESSPPIVSTRGDFEVDADTEADDAVIDYLPDAQSVFQIGLGGIHKKPVETQQGASPLHISIKHADLKYAKYPVAVGHYVNDPIMHAERALDQVLNLRLTQRHNVGLYPGEIGTSEVVFSTRSNLSTDGALVVGLGEFGQLTAAKLERTLTSAFINYIIEYNEWNTLRHADIDSNEIGLSVLLMGSGIGGVSVQDSIASLLRAAREANKKVAALKDSNLRTLSHVELVELWQDLALLSAHRLKDFVNRLKDKSVIADYKVIQGNGSKKRASFSDDVAWWHRIVITHNESGNLHYNVFTRKARTELEHEAIDLRFVDHYLNEITTTTSFSPNSASSPQRTLFELLLPNRMKDSSPDSDRILLNLDEYAARYPWEMLIDGWADKPQPLAVNKQIIRQLSVDKRRDNPQPATGNQALVIGDPPTGDQYARLPGAREEARLVSTALSRAERFKVVDLIAEQDDDESIGLNIVQELLSREYAILHAAAHGTYETASEKIDTIDTDVKSNQPVNDSGIVIGPDLILSPLLVSKMRKVPEVVFLNCCHLGKIEYRRPDKRIAYNDIAANLSTEFIRMGSKVVIAAGWAVEDAPAKLFAKEFYDCLLSGATFAESVKQARKEVFNTYPYSNTFGAYQCWGDPEFKLQQAPRSASNAKDDHYFHSDYELEVEIQNIRSSVKTAGDDSEKSLLADLNGVFDKFYKHEEDKDRDKSRITIEFGRAFSEFGNLKKGIELMRKALSENAESVSLADISELANFEARHAVAIHIDDEVEKLDEKPLALTRTALKRLQNLLDSAHTSTDAKSHEQIYPYVASAYRRQAMVCTRASQIASALDKMCIHYGLAWVGEQKVDNPIIKSISEMARSKNIKPDNYVFANFVLSCIVKAWFPKGEELTRPDQFLADSVASQVNNTRSLSGRGADFWAAMELADCLILYLLNDSLKKKAGESSENNEIVEEIKTLYENVKLRAGSKREWSSVYDNLLFISIMLEKKPSGTKNIRKFVQRKKYIDDLLAIVGPWAGR